MVRHAISPRLAMKSLLIGRFWRFGIGSQSILRRLVTGVAGE
jgi:hypothetical protein